MTQSRQQIRELKRELRNQRAKFIGPRRRLRDWVDKNHAEFWLRSGGNVDEALAISKEEAEKAGFGLVEILLIIELVTVVYKILKAMGLFAIGPEVLAFVRDEEDEDDE